MLGCILVGSRYIHRAQSVPSAKAWGDLRGTSMQDAAVGLQEPWRIRLLLDTADEAMDTGEVRTVALTGGRVLLLPSAGKLFGRWEPVALDIEARMALMAEHLRRLAWALDSGRPLPHLPAALRGAPAASSPAARP